MNVRLAAITERLAQHLHSVVEEFQVTESELLQAIEFFNEVGKKDQYMLLSDVLGISVAVDNITFGSKHDEKATEHNVEGPLYRGEAPLTETPATLYKDDPLGEILVMSGQVLSSQDGRPLAKAVLDVWSTNEHGYYENEDPEQTEYNLRGRVLCDEEGRFELRTVIPAAYEIGRTGPVGEFLKEIGRHSWRPGHIHFKVTSEGHSPLTTQLFIPDDPWIESDSIGAVKESLILKFDRHDNLIDLKQYGLDRPFYTCRYDFILSPDNKSSKKNGVN